MKKWILFIALSLMFSCQSKKNKSEETQIEPLNASMQALKEQIEALMPEAFQQKVFLSPVNEQRLNARLTQLRNLAQAVKHDKALQVDDPILQKLAAGFSEEIARSQVAFASGQKEYARNSVIHAVSYCIECHTRTTLGPQFVSQPNSFALQDVRAIERGQYRLALREFRPALEDFLSVVESKNAGSSVFDYEKAVRLSLMIGVRFLNEPEVAERVSKAILAPQGQSPYFLRTSANGWQQAIASWRKEQAGPPSRQSRLAVAKALVDAAKRRQVLGDERSGDIEMLRAQRELHLFLEANPPRTAEKAEAMYWLGVAYTSFRDHAAWNLQEAYFENCIRLVPHSVLAKRCYSAIEENYYADYSGSGGFDLPEDLKSKLLNLRKLSVEKTSAP